MSTVNGASWHAGAALVVIFALAGCVSQPGNPPTTTAAPSPAVSESAPAGSAFTLDCSDVGLVIDGTGLFETDVVFSQPGDVQGLLPHLYPGDREIIAAGGLACTSFSAPLVRVSALADASTEFFSALAAASEASTDSPIGASPHQPSDLGDEGVTTCRDAGAGGLCTWSLLFDDIWLVVDLFPLELGDLVFPPDRPDGWAQQPYPAPGSLPLATVTAVADALGANRSEGPGPVPVTSPRCTAIVSAEALGAEFGVSAGDVTVQSITSADVARSVASTAGYALPYFAADRLGWDRCRASWMSSDSQLLNVTLATRPTSGGDVGAETSCRAHPDGPGLLCDGAAVVDGQYRVIALEGSAPAGAEVPLGRVLTG